MKYLISILWLILILCLQLMGCSGGGATTPELDTTAPTWDDMIGVTELTGGDKQVTVRWGTASDNDSPPVVYLIYIDNDDNPWDQTPIEISSGNSHVVNDLINDQPYWVGVRCRDSASLPNIDSNMNTLSVTLHGVFVPDNEPPVWDTAVGVKGVIPGDRELTLSWGTATDALSPPVIYLLYIDEDINPWDQIPVEVTTNDDYTITGLENGITYYCSVRVRDSASPSNMDSNEFIIQAVPEAEDNNWLYTWGGEYGDAGSEIIIDDNGDIYLIGGFTGTVNLDPTGGVDEFTADDSTEVTSDRFLTKFSSTGAYMWSRVWSSEGSWGISEVMLDDAGNFICVGYFGGTVDFDPSPSEEIRFTGYGKNAYLLKLASNGDLIWVKTWGDEHERSNEKETASGVDIDSLGNIYVCGSFDDTVDLNPGPGVDEYTSTNPTRLDTRDYYLTKFDSQGNFLWTKVCGGSRQDSANDVEINNWDEIYLAGTFGNTVDFDPGPGIEEVTIEEQSAENHSFLCRFDPAGEFEWVKTWGSSTNSSCSEIILADSGNVYVWGKGDPVLKMQPGWSEYGLFPIQYHIGRFDRDGNPNWARTLAAYCSDMCLDASENIVITGYYRYEIDFDPGNGELMKTTGNDVPDAFVLGLESNGEFRMLELWEGPDDQKGSSCAVDSLGDYLITGYFENYADFDYSIEYDIRNSAGEADIFLKKYTP